jgi:membrane-associated phospholipid phosphatase
MTTHATGRYVGRFATRSHRAAFAEVRGAAVRLVLAAAVLWGAMCGLGYLLTHQLAGTSFENWDASVSRRFARNRTATWNTITHWATYCGETVTVIAICAVFFVALRLALGRWRESMFLATAVVLQAIIFTLTTLVIERHRPPVPHLDSSPPTSSFPSGHMSASVTLYGGIAIIAVWVGARMWLRALAVVGGIVIPLCVAFARLYRGMHYVTDLAGSVLLGLSCLTITWAVILRRHRAARRDAL